MIFNKYDAVSADLDDPEAGAAARGNWNCSKSSTRGRINAFRSFRRMPMNELALKYGATPTNSRIYGRWLGPARDRRDGKPGCRFLDTLNSIQLVKELKAPASLPRRPLVQMFPGGCGPLGLPLTGGAERCTTLPRILSSPRWPAPMPAPACRSHVFVRRLDRPLRGL